ncbi:hypothetical protein HDU97_001428 [Phlyctochytrium planicorne]|nr:hypothetical protein HDU97_001428 [Phlyctochytrium planicorne]
MLHFIRIFLLPLCEIAIICLLVLKSCSNDKDHPQCFFGDAALAALDPQTNGDGSYLTWGQVITFLTFVSFFHTAVRLMADDSAKALFEVMARFQAADRNLIPDVPMIWTKSRFEPAGMTITKRGRKSYRLPWNNLYDTVQFFRSLFILLIIVVVKVLTTDTPKETQEMFVKDPNSYKPANLRVTVMIYIGFSVLLLGFALKLAAVAVISSPVQRHAAELMTKVDKAANAVADHEKHRLLQTRNLTRTTFGDLKAWVRFDEEQKKPVLHVNKKAFSPQEPPSSTGGQKVVPPLVEIRDLDFPDTGMTPSEEMFTKLSYPELWNAVGFVLAPVFLWAVWSHTLYWWFAAQVAIVVLSSGFFRLFIRVTSSYVASGYLMGKYKRLQNDRNPNAEHIPQAQAAPSQPMAQPRVSSLPSEPVPPPNAEIHAAPLFVSSTAPSAVSSYPPSQGHYSGDLPYQSHPQQEQPYSYPNQPNSYIPTSNPASYPPYNPTQPFDCRTTFVNQYHQQQQQQAGYTPQNPYAQNANAPMNPYQPGPSGFMMSSHGANVPSSASFSTLTPDHPDPVPPSQPHSRIPNAYIPPTTTPTDPLSSVTKSTLNTALWIRWFVNVALAGILSSAYALLLSVTYNPETNIVVKSGFSIRAVKICLTIPTVIMFLAIVPYYLTLAGPRAVFYDLMFDHLTGVRCRLMIEETEKREKVGKEGLGDGKNETRKSKLF